MCGITGHFGRTRKGQWRQTHVILESLFVESEHRGREATGFAALTSPYHSPHQNSVITGKQPMPATQFIKTNMHWRQLHHRRCCAVLGHCRYPTHGSPMRNDNNQPLSSSNGRWHVTHNGIIEGHQRIAREAGLKLNTECDSEILLRLIQRFRSAPKALNAAVRHLPGSIAVAVLDARKGIVYLARNDARPLWITRLRDGRWFFASTDGILIAALRQVLGRRFMDDIEMLMPLASGHVHALTDHGLRVVEPRR